jgi:hypothetical protein
MADKKPLNVYSDPSLGQFNIFRLAPILEKNNSPTVYRARAHFKITLVKGSGVFHYADKSVVIKEQAIALGKARPNHQRFFLLFYARFF